MAPGPELARGPSQSSPQRPPRQIKQSPNINERQHYINDSQSELLQ